MLLAVQATSVRDGDAVGSHDDIPAGHQREVVETAEGVQDHRLKPNLSPDGRWPDLAHSWLVHLGSKVLGHELLQDRG